MRWSQFAVATICLYFVIVCNGTEDVPCAVRWSKDETMSSVCVCNETYCDTITREQPAPGSYVAYLSSKSGLRFHKSRGSVVTVEEPNNLDLCAQRTLIVDPDLTYQTIEGFGGAVTDAAAIHYINMTKPLRHFFINSYYSRSGIEYNMARTPIGGSDFSTRPYAYHEQPENDPLLRNFTLAQEDYKYKIPLFRAAMEAATAPIHVVGTTWSPPAWMKTNRALVGISRLKPEYYQTYVLYHLLFIEKYTEQGVPIWALTTTNEPFNGVIPLRVFNSLGWTAASMGKWIAENLGPTLRNSTYRNVKIICADDQRLILPYYFTVMITERPDCLPYIDGVGVHSYTDRFTPAFMLTEAMKKHPDKFLLATESCEGTMPYDELGVKIGSWTRAKNYILDIMSDLNHNSVGWLDWNLCLDETGGPNWANNNVDAPIIFFTSKKEFIKQPMFYAMGHFSKFVPRGSKRIKVFEKKCMWKQSVDRVAFLTPMNTVVVILYNDGRSKDVNLQIRKKLIQLTLERTSITTIEISL